MKVYNKILLAITISALSITTVNAQAVPKPATPDPTLPDKSANQERYTYIDRPYKAANDIKYKQVPIDKAKIGKYMKKMPKGGFLELGIAVGILALGEAVDYLIDNANVVKFDSAEYYYRDGFGRDFDSVDDLVVHHCTNNSACMHGHHVRKDQEFSWQLRGINSNRDSVYVTTIYKLKKEPKNVKLDDMADKVIDSAKNGNPTAVRVINDWADDEIRGNPDAYPDVVPRPTPSPNPNPIGDPKTNPSPNPNAPPSGNPNPADNPSGTPNTQPDPSTNPSDGTKPNEQTFELPPFCSWASHVCKFIDWVKEPSPKPEENKPIPKANLNDIHDLQELDRFKKRIDFEGQCPTGELSFSVKSVAYSYKIPYHHFCSLLEQLRPWLLAFAYLSTAFFVVSNL